MSRQKNIISVATFIAFTLITAQLLGQSKSSLFIPGSEKYTRQPGFKEGNTDGLANLFLYNFQYRGAELNVEGKIFLDFTVTPDGKIKDAKVEKGILESLDKEALRVLNLTNGKWICGQVGNQDMDSPVKFVFYALPENFSKYKDIKKKEKKSVKEKIKSGDYGSAADQLERLFTLMPANEDLCEILTHLPGERSQKLKEQYCSKNQPQ